LEWLFEDVHKEVADMFGKGWMILVFVLMAATSLFGGMSESEKKTYNRLTYQEVVAQRKTMEVSAKKRKVVFQILFNSTQEGVPVSFSNSKVLSQRYWLIKFAGEDSLLPVIFNTRNQELKRFLLASSPDTLCNVYGKLGAVKKKQKAYYYVDVTGVEAAKTEVEDETVFKKEDYAEVEARRLDIRFADYEDKKVRFVAKFRGIRNLVPKEMASVGVKSEKYFMLQLDGFATPVIVARGNGTCVEPIISAKSGDKFGVYGTMRKLEDSSGRSTKTFYYLSAVAIVNETPEELK